MSSDALIYPMLAHVGWTTLLYVVLTIVRAPTVWGIGSPADGTNPWVNLEPRVSANLRNQFEWPVYFYVACLLLQFEHHAMEPIQFWLAWAFVGGRIAHSFVQIFISDVRVRGIVFAINFVAVLGMWGQMLLVPMGPGS